MICKKCGTNNDSDKEVCAVCGARLLDHDYGVNDLMKPMGNQVNNNDVSINYSNDKKTDSSTFKFNRKFIKPLLIVLILVVIGIFGYLIIKNVNYESEHLSKYSGTPYNSIEEPAWVVMHDVLMAYSDKSREHFDFGSDKYIVCFGTTQDEDCNITGGQIIPGEDIELSYPLVSGKVIIDVANLDFVYCKDLKFESGYSCTSKDGEIMNCILD